MAKLAMRLSGWHRLWIFGSILYLLLVLLVAPLLVPTRNDIRLSEEWLLSLAPEDASALIQTHAMRSLGRHMSEAAPRALEEAAPLSANPEGLRDPLVGTSPEPSDAGRRALEQATFTPGQRVYDPQGQPRIVRRQLPDGGVELEPLDAVIETTQEMPNGDVLRFWPETEQATVAAVARAYEDALDTQLRQERRAFALWAAAFWLVPCLVAYALGWAVGWIYRGFAAP